MRRYGPAAPAIVLWLLLLLGIKSVHPIREWEALRWAIGSND